MNAACCTITGCICCCTANRDCCYSDIIWMTWGIICSIEGKPVCVGSGATTLASYC
ncbi:hypothetical protein PR003_g7215 [Phytophthora rubi]|uniref:Uncharacterized protein n=1 Tax=Phytophthora rubi TaxID=129364 RepID=A0A6A4FME5_9STRA|nr:hypothetical protein PR001_g6801 [Phytophthora rubi]KAE9346894.1 hypothetical protein PR003_g7215 [Phytophthora rubi]